MTIAPDLFPHQRAAVKRIAAGVPTYLGFDMGIGKTRTFIEAAKARGATRVLVLCPASAILVWKRELSLWAPSMPFVVVRRAEDLVKVRGFLIVSHGLLSQRGGQVAEALWRVPPFDMTAIDEAHAYNAADTLRVKALRKAANAKRLGAIVPLSGTPMRNHAGDLYTLTALCSPFCLTRTDGHLMTRTEFEDLFCKVTTKYFGGSRPIRVIEGSKNLPILKELLAPFMVRVKKEEVLKDLPPITWEPVQVPLDTSHLSAEDQQKLSDGVTLSLQDAGNDDAALAALSRAGAPGGQLMALRRMLGLAKLKGSLDYIVDVLDCLPPNRKVLVFAVHADVIKAVVDHLGEYSPAVLTGQSTSAERANAVEQFLTNPACRVFVGNIQAAGTALTLVGPTCKCSDVIFVESSWTPADNAQAACRVHRIGQHDGVTARMISAAGTIDDLIEALLIRKAQEFSALFDGSANIKTPASEGATT